MTDTRIAIDYQERNGIIVPVEIEVKPEGHCAKFDKDIWGEELQCKSFIDKDHGGGRILLPMTCSVCEHLQ